MVYTTNENPETVIASDRDTSSPHKDDATLQADAVAAAKAGDTTRLADAVSSGLKIQHNRELLKAILAGADYKACFDLLLSPPYSLNLRDENLTLGYLGTPLRSAVGKHDVEFVQLLLSHGADPNKSEGATPAGLGALEIAAMNDDTAILGTLLDGGAHLRDSGALQTAAAEGRLDALKLLLQRGAAVDEVVEHKSRSRRLMRPALAEAVARGRVEAVKVLLDAGASLETRGVDGKSVLDLIQTEASPNVKDIFKSRGLVN